MAYKSMLLWVRAVFLVPKFHLVAATHSCCIFDKCLQVWNKNLWWTGRGRRCSDSPQNAEENLSDKKNDNNFVDD